MAFLPVVVIALAVALIYSIVEMHETLEDIYIILIGLWKKWRRPPISINPPPQCGIEIELVEV